MSVELAINLNRIANALRRKPNKKASLMLKAMMKRVAVTADDFAFAAYVYVPDYIIGNLGAPLSVEGGGRLQDKGVDAAVQSLLNRFEIRNSAQNRAQMKAGVDQIIGEAQDKMARIGQSILTKYSARGSLANEALEQAYDKFVTQGVGKVLGERAPNINSISDLKQLLAPIGIVTENAVKDHLSQQVSNLVDLADEDMPEGTVLDERLRAQGLLPEREVSSKEIGPIIDELADMGQIKVQEASKFFQTNSMREAQKLAAVITACKGFGPRALNKGSLNAISAVLILSHVRAAVFGDDRELSELVDLSPRDLPSGRSNAAKFLKDKLDEISLTASSEREIVDGLGKLVGNLKIPQLDIGALYDVVKNRKFVPNIRTTMNKTLFYGLREVVLWEEGHNPVSPNINESCRAYLAKVVNQRELAKIRRKLQIKSPSWGTQTRTDKTLDIRDEVRKEIIERN